MEHGDVVLCPDGYGRIMYHDPCTRDIHVMIRLGRYSWVIRKYYERYVARCDTFLWEENMPFHR